MKILLVGSAGHNKGSASAIKSTVQSLRELSNAEVYLLTALPELDSKQCEVATFEYPTQSSGKFGTCRKTLDLLLCFVLAALYRLFKIDINRLISLDKVGLLQSYGTADIIVFCSTDIISDTYGIVMLFQSLKDIGLCALLKKPIAMNATQIGPFRRTLSGRIAILLTKLTLNRVDLITVRDQISADNLRRMNVSRPLIRITADPAFLLYPAPRERTESILAKEGVDTSAKPLIGINTSALIYRYIKESNLERKLEEYTELMSKITKYVIEEFDAEVVLFPHVFGPRRNDDRIIGKKIFERVGYEHKLKLIMNEYKPEELKGIIGQFDLLISTRMHPVIHAISMHTPVVGVDYTFKMKELMKAVAQQQYLCNIATLDYNKLKSRIDHAYNARDKIRNTLKTKSKVLQERALLNAKLIMDLTQKTN